MSSQDNTYYPLRKAGQLAPNVTESTARIDLERLISALDSKLSPVKEEQMKLELKNLFNLNDHLQNQNQENIFQQICSNVLRFYELDEGSCSNVRNLNDLKRLYNNLVRSNSRLRKAEHVLNPCWSPDKFRTLVEIMSGREYFQNNNNLRFAVVLVAAARVWNDLRYQEQRDEQGEEQRGRQRVEKRVTIEGWHYSFVRELLRDNSRDNNGYLLPLCPWKGDVFVLLLAALCASGNINRDACGVGQNR